MPLDRSDYRECLLMNFRKYRRAQPASPLRCAFLYAKAMTAELPLDIDSRNFYDALQCFRAWEANGSNDDLPSAKRLRLNWQISWTLTRSAHSATR